MLEEVQAGKSALETPPFYHLSFPDLMYFTKIGVNNYAF